MEKCLGDVMRSYERTLTEVYEPNILVVFFFLRFFYDVDQRRRWEILTIIAGISYILTHT